MSYIINNYSHFHKSSIIKLGTNYGGWAIPSSNILNDKSLIISVGVGEDISFDLHLNHLYNSKIILIDPTIKAIKHYQEVQNYFNSNTPFTGNIQPDYISNIKNLQINFDNFDYIPKALWNESKILKFYKQSNPSYVSQSLIDGMFTSEYDEVESFTFSDIIDKYGNNIDLLKLDIEGAEIQVLNHMLDLEIYPKYLLVEFDLLIKNKDSSNLTKKIIDRLLCHYDIFCNFYENITFIHKSLNNTL